MSLSLRDKAAEFADELQRTLRAVLPGDIEIQSTASPMQADRYVVRPVGESAGQQRVPLHVDGEVLATLSLAFYLGMDRVDKYLKTVRTDLAIHSTLDRTPLVRLDYRSDMTRDPVAHWQVHAERGSMSHLLARAHAVRPRLVSKPHDLSSLHFPVGGERFRPCLEDFLEFAVHECGVDSVAGWEGAIASGREVWRRRQLRASVRDAQAEAAKALTEQGWTLVPPKQEPEENTRIFTVW